MASLHLLVLRLVLACCFLGSLGLRHGFGRGLPSTTKAKQAARSDSNKSPGFPSMVLIANATMLDSTSFNVTTSNTTAFNGTISNNTSSTTSALNATVAGTVSSNASAVSAGAATTKASVSGWNATAVVSATALNTSAVNATTGAGTTFLVNASVSITTMASGSAVITTGSNATAAAAGGLNLTVTVAASTAGFNKTGASSPLANTTRVSTAAANTTTRVASAAATTPEANATVLGIPGSDTTFLALSTITVTETWELPSTTITRNQTWTVSTWTAPTPTETSSSGGYSPSTESNYSQCLFDPDSGTSFNLLGDKGLPIVDNDGLLTQASDILPSLRLFRLLAAPDSPSGVFDLGYSDNGTTFYVAVFRLGNIGLVTKSSNGQRLVDSDSGVAFITTIFSIQCDGLLTAGIVGGQRINFAMDSNGTIFSQPSYPAVSGFVSKQAASTDILDGFHILPRISTAQSIMADTRGQRCPASDQYAVFQGSSWDLALNGCGTNTGIGSYVPELGFTSCCNDHDICYGNCTKNWVACNTAFRDCMMARCNNLFSSHRINSLEHWGCQKVAQLYYVAVGSPIGLEAFQSSTADACSCLCDDPTMTACGADCVDIATDPTHCGRCSTQCTAGCINGACSSAKCVGRDASEICGASSNCGCASSLDGMDFCVPKMMSSNCSSAQRCMSDATCPLGSICASGNGCGAVCQSTSLC